MSWGKGGFVGIRRAIWEHDQTIRKAQAILAIEHGIRHRAGEHDLCPLCREDKEKAAASGKQKASD